MRYCLTRTQRPLSFVEPLAAQSVRELPRGSDWSYEIKFDGYRALAPKDRDNVRLLSRRNKDLTLAFPSVAKAIAGVRTRLLSVEVRVSNAA